MKTILIMFLYIASAQCGVLKDDLKKVGSTSNAAEHRIQQVELIKVIDSYETGGITLLNDILIDVTKDKESQGTNIETDTSGLAPGLHTWETQFLSSEQSQQEINRILGIVETTANKTGQLLSKTCTTGDTAVTCHFNINIGVTNANKSKIQKREIQILNNEPTDRDEINRILNLVEAAGNTNGDGKNCKTVDGALICNVYLPAESTSQSPSKIYKREIGHQANTQLEDEGGDMIIPDATNAWANTKTDSNTNYPELECLFAESSFLADLFGAYECPSEEFEDEYTIIPDATDAFANTTTDSNTNYPELECRFEDLSSLADLFVADVSLAGDAVTCKEVIMVLRAVKEPQRGLIINSLSDHE